MKVWIAFIVAVVSMVCCSLVYGDGPEGWTVGLLTNEATDQVEGRVGVRLSQEWEVGGLGKWFSEDAAGKDYGAGGYIKMTVDPNATVALQDWLPGNLGEWLSLPESVDASSYLIAKLIYADTVASNPLSSALGAGFEIGPASLEVLYELVEAGESLDPQQESGLAIWFGVCLDL